MRKITALGSVHTENGLCNVEELLKILQELKPDVVFMELRPSEFDFYHAQGSLEPRAIKKFRETEKFQEVAVDRHGIRFDLPNNVRDEMQKVFEYLDQPGTEYHRLMDEEYGFSNKFGFKYLNSARYENLRARLREIEDDELAEPGRENFLQTVKKWRQVTVEREFEMVRNIYAYAGEHVFNTGVFLFGASHKSGVRREIAKYASTDADLIKWSFTYG